jgi:GNAT superfamily N-acetyltransferase
VRSGGNAGTRFVLSQITRQDDARLPRVGTLLQRVFADPNSVLGVDRMREFLASPSSARTFCIVVAEDPSASGDVIGVCVFSYVPRSNCGFSEYLVVDRSARRLGLGRALFDRRKALLDQLAGGTCQGVFIEVDSPRRTPPELIEAERESSIDPLERLQVFAHLGFRRVGLEYVQPPLGEGKEAVDYLDLLFVPFRDTTVGSIPTDWVLLTVEAIWSAWTPATVALYLDALRKRTPIPRVDLLDPLVY